RHTAEHAMNPLEAGREVYPTWQRLERRREDGFASPSARLLLAATEAHERAEVELGRPAREALARHQLGAAGREHADGRAGIGGEQVLRDDEPERGVAEQRERLVVGRGRGFVRV